MYSDVRIQNMVFGADFYLASPKGIAENNVFPKRHTKARK